MTRSVLRSPLTLRTLLALFAAAAVSVGSFAVGQRLQTRRATQGDAGVAIAWWLVAVMPDWRADVRPGCADDTAGGLR